MNQAVSLTFSLKYLVNFSKSTSLSRQVQLMMSADVPLLVSSCHSSPFIPFTLVFRWRINLPKGRSITTSLPRSAMTKRRWGPNRRAFQPNLHPHSGSLISLYFIFYDPKIFARLYLTITFSKSICNPIR